MQGFIDKKYYVRCSTREEIIDFLAMCENENLLMRNGGSPASFTFSESMIIFAYDWCGPGDHISVWSGGSSDGMLPEVPFANIVPLCKVQSLPDFLDLL